MFSDVCRGGGGGGGGGVEIEHWREMSYGKSDTTLINKRYIVNLTKEYASSLGR